MRERDDLAQYLADNYGRCRLAAGCRCLRTGWIGRACPHWMPTTARDLDELRTEMRRLYADAAAVPQ